MPPQTQPKIEQKSRPPISPRDQGSLFALAIAALVLVASSWFYHGGHRSGLIAIDRATPLEARFQVDINRADWPELIQLPGLGETLARSVVDHRLINGDFQSLEDLQQVHGIGVKTLEKIRPYLRPIPKETEWAAVERDTPGSIP